MNNETETETMALTIDGDREADVTVENVEAGKNAARISSGRREWVVCDDYETAGLMARERWADMARNDRKEFASIIGEERLAQWALGESDSFGISSLEEFLNAIEDHPEEEFAGYDSEERDVTDVTADLVEELGFTPTVAYRLN